MPCPKPTCEFGSHAGFRGPDAFVRPRELTRTSHIKKPRALVVRLLPISAADRLDDVADALVGLLGGVAPVRQISGLAGEPVRGAVRSPMTTRAFSSRVSYGIVHLR